MRATGFRLRDLTLLLVAIVVAAGFSDGRAQSQSNELSSPPFLTIRPIITTGLVQPLYLTHAGDGSGRLFIVEQAGRIRILTQGTLQSIPFLDISDLVWAGGERGLLGLAFHPNYARNGRFFVSYTRQPNGAAVVAE